jgi:outer membrane immunogenic protein
MKKLALHLTAACLLFAGSASAADLRRPIKAAPPPAPAPIYNWTGCYIGGGGGYGLLDIERRHHDGAFVHERFDIGGRGWFGTVQVGCDYQVAPYWVIGVFADYDFSDIRARTNVSRFNMIGDENHRNTWAVGGRIGWLPYQTILLYVSGGYTQTDFDRVDFRDDRTGARMNIHLDENDRSGWFVGGGYEYGIQWLPGLFWKTEYRLAEFERDRDFFIDTRTGLRLDDSLERRTFIQTVRSELVWRFNFGNWGGGAPVAARY